MLWVLLAINPAPLRADGNKTIPVTLDSGGTPVTLDGVVDAGSTSTGVNLPNQNFPSPATIIDRATAQSMGLLDKDGNPVAGMFETNPDGSIASVGAQGVDGNVFAEDVTKPISITATDDTGKKTTVKIRVVVPTDPKSKTPTILGKDFLIAVDGTQAFKTDKLTFSNTPTEGTGKKKTSVDKLPYPGGLPRAVWTGVSFASASNSVTGDAFLDFTSPYTLLSESTASTLDMSSTGTLDLSDDPGLLDALETAGFYSETAPSFGLFDEAILPTLDITMDDGSLVQFDNTPVLIDSVTTQNVLGYDLLSQGAGTVDGAPLGEIADVTPAGATYFSATPEPAPLWMVGAGLAFICSLRRGRSGHRPSAA